MSHQHGDDQPHDHNGGDHKHIHNGQDWKEHKVLKDDKKK